MNTSAVRDLMLPLSGYATVSADKTVREALLALNDSQLGLSDDRHQHRAVLVLSTDGQVVGKLTHWAILRALEPGLHRKGDLDALHRAGLSPSFIDSVVRSLPVPGDSLDGLCRAAARIPVREAMVPAGESVEASTPLLEAVRMLVLNHAQSMLVRDAGPVVGILRLTDVFEALAKRIREEA
jgi:CBS domain-containing protein